MPCARGRAPNRTTRTEGRPATVRAGPGGSSASTPSATRPSGATPLQLHQAIEGEALGGVGPGVSPKTALAVGLKVDSEALPRLAEAGTRRRAGRPRRSRDDARAAPAQRRRRPQGLLRATTGRCGRSGSSAPPATRPSTTRSRPASGAGSTAGRTATSTSARSSRWRPNKTPITDLLQVDEATRQRTCSALGGRASSTPSSSSTARASARTGRSAATLIPPAFGLAGVNLHTYTGWGSVTYWNAFVANLEMHGKGTFFDPAPQRPGQVPGRRAGPGSSTSATHPT